MIIYVKEFRPEMGNVALICLVESVNTYIPPVSKKKKICFFLCKNRDGWWQQLIGLLLVFIISHWLLVTCNDLSELLYLLYLLP